MKLKKHHKIKERYIKLKNTKAMYSIFTNEEGNALDDVIFWKFETHIILICNAINRYKITTHLTKNEISRSPSYT